KQLRSSANNWKSNVREKEEKEREPKKRREETKKQPPLFGTEHLRLLRVIPYSYPQFILFQPVYKKDQKIL
ncbi:hypothetical protein QOT17_025371, partial [Balamuthia mandrillaris]